MLTARHNSRRVVITGLGLVTPLGSNVKQSWENLIKGKNGVRPITLFDARTFDSRIAAEIINFDSSHFTKKKSSFFSRATMFALTTAREAWNSSGLARKELDRSQAGVCFGGSAVWQTPEEVAYLARFSKKSKIDSTAFFKKRAKLDPFLIFKRGAHSPSFLTAIELGLQGPNLGIHTACASSAHAIGNAYRIIKRGDADLMFTGGCDSLITPMGVASFSLLGALSKRNDEPEKASRPFDINRDGFVMGEGAGCLVLEEMNFAKARGAHIYAEILGFGTSLNAYRMTDCSPGGLREAIAMRSALEEAGVQISEVNYINAHGTSTPQNDVAETQAIKKVFKEHAFKLSVSSIKSMVGHLIAASAAVEFIATVLSVAEDRIPPTINYELEDPECDLDYTPNTMQKKQVNVALKNSFGFGGQNAVLVVGKPA